MGFEGYAITWAVGYEKRQTSSGPTALTNQSSIALCSNLAVGLEALHRKTGLLTQIVTLAAECRAEAVWYMAISLYERVKELQILLSSCMNRKPIADPMIEEVLSNLHISFAGWFIKGLSKLLGCGLG